MSLPQSVSPYLLGLRHIGIVTEDGAATVSRLQTLFGIADDAIVQIPAPDHEAETRFWFFEIGGQAYEVIQPVSDTFKALLLRDGQGSNRGINHVCYNVSDLDAAVAAMGSAGVRLGHVTPTGIVELPQQRMAYFNPEDTAGLLIEFVQTRS